MARMNLRASLGVAAAAMLSITAAAAAPPPQRAASSAATQAAAGAVVPANNSIHVISPYRQHGAWVFDDPQRGLVREAFVSGADDWMERMAAAVPEGRARGFTLVFSAKPFPGAQRRLQYRRAEHGGAWYYDPEMRHEGWLCSTLFDYFAAAPRELWVQVKPREA